MAMMREHIPDLIVEQETEISVSGARSRPMAWGPIWVGSVTALVLAVLIGLVGTAVGIQEFAPGRRVASWSEFGVMALIFSVAGVFFAFVAGGWAAVKLSGVTWAEPAMIQGAIVWLMAVPMLLLFVALGAGAFGGWYGGLASPAGAPEPEFQVARNGALGAATTLLIGLVGAVLGGWLASGEEMTFNLRRRGRRERRLANGRSEEGGHHHDVDHSVAARRAAEPHRDPVAVRSGKLTINERGRTA